MGGHDTRESRVKDLTIYSCCLFSLTFSSCGIRLTQPELKPTYSRFRSHHGHNIQLNGKSRKLHALNRTTKAPMGRPIKMTLPGWLEDEGSIAIEVYMCCFGDDEGSPTSDMLPMLADGAKITTKKIAQIVLPLICGSRATRTRFHHLIVSWCAAPRSFVNR